MTSTHTHLRWLRNSAACFLVLCGSANAQNRIPNSSFEEINFDCFWHPHDLNAVYQWNWPGCAGWSVYFNACNTTNFPGTGAPQNFGGYAPPPDGDAYLGILTYDPSDFQSEGGNPKHYPMVRLYAPLMAGEEYCIRMMVSLMDSATHRTGSLHCLLWYDSTSTCGNNDVRWPEFAAVTFDTENVGKEGWTLLESSFTANGGESTLTFGDFQYGVDLDTAYIGDGSVLAEYAGYYVDQVYLGPCDVGVAEGSWAGPLLVVAPNPVRTGESVTVHVSAALGDMRHLELIDPQGRVIRSVTTATSPIQLRTEGLPPGAYGVRLRADDGPIASARLVIR